MADFDAIWLDRPDRGTAAHSRWHRYADQRIRRGIGIDYAVAHYEGGVCGFDGVAGGNSARRDQRGGRRKTDGPTLTKLCSRIPNFLRDPRGAGFLPAQSIGFFPQFRGHGDGAGFYRSPFAGVRLAPGSFTFSAPVHSIPRKSEA